MVEEGKAVNELMVRSRKDETGDWKEEESRKGLFCTKLIAEKMSQGIFPLAHLLCNGFATLSLLYLTDISFKDITSGMLFYRRQPG